MILICLIISSLKLVEVAPQGLVAHYPNAEETCENLENGRHCVRDCFAFMVCNNGEKILLACPRDQVYHNGAKKCVPSYEVTKDNFCYERPDGPYRNPWDCAKFIQCVKGWTHEEQCEEGLKYDAVSNSCNNATFSQYCYILGKSGINTSSTLDHPIVQHPTVIDVKENVNSNKLLDEKSSEESCVGLTDGKHCSRDCFSYLVCNNGSKTVVHCNQSQIYNPVLKACDTPTSINKGNFCVYRPNGAYRNPWDCHSFIKCLKGIAEIEICAAGLTYIAEHNTCENDTFVQHCHVIVSENAILSTTSLPTTTPAATTTASTTTKTTQTTTTLPPTTTITTTTTTTPTTTLATTTTTSTTTAKQLPENTTTQGNTTDDVDLITPEELLIRLQNNEIPLIDVREPWEIKLEGRIAHSVNIPVSKIDSALKLSPEEFLNIYHYDKPLTNDCRIVFHCKSGVRSAHALYIAKQNGYKCAKSLKGGYSAWKALYP